MDDIFTPNKKFDDARFAANVECLDLLTRFVNQHREMRFSQVLSALGLDSIHPIEEPQATLIRLKNRINDLEGDSK